MIAAIISDTHDNLATLDKFLDFAGNIFVGTIIHCGDIASGETLERIADKFDGNILAAFGNMDYRESVMETAKKFPGKITLFEDFGQASLGGLKIGFCHHRESGLEYCKKGRFDYIFYGHSHKPWQETVPRPNSGSSSCQLANPGNLAGLIYKATFATLDTKTKQLALHLVERLPTKNAPA